MTDFYLDPTTNDISLVNGDFRLCETVEELTRQKIYVTLSVNRGSWKFNIGFGPPWLENENSSIQLLGKVPRGVVDGYIQQAILSRAGVTSIREYTSVWDKVAGTMDIEFKAGTEEGIISVSTTIQV